MKRHIVRARLTAAAIAGITGCQSKPAQPQAAAAPSQQQQPHPPAVGQPEATPQPTPAHAGTPEALKFKLELGTREVETLMCKRARKGGEPSAADFLEPEDFRIGPASHEPLAKAEPPVQVVRVANPIIESTPSVPNQCAALATPQ